MKTLKSYIKEMLELEEYLKTLDIEEDYSYDSETCEDEDEFIDSLTEEEQKHPEKGKVSSDTKGKLHELLVGHHLLGGKHMSKHADKSGDSPKQAHDKLKSTVHPNDYKKINARAKSAAHDIKSKVEVNGHKIHDVHWTSKPGDLHRSTGIHASQKEDASDVVVTTHHPKTKAIVHHGVSLKVTDSSSKHVPTSNPGIEYAGPNAKKHLEDHRKSILKKHPELKKASNASERKGMMKANPAIHEFVKTKNTETLHKVAKDLHHHLNSIPKSELVHHIKHILHSKSTPMEKEGHKHIRHTTYSSKGEFNHHSMNPGSHHEHIYRDSRNITVHHSGTSIHFKHNGKTFGRHAIKFSSQSDPMSSIKGSGQTSGD